MFCLEIAVEYLSKHFIVISVHWLYLFIELVNVRQELVYVVLFDGLLYVPSSFTLQTSMLCIRSVILGENPRPPMIIKLRVLGQLDVS